MLGIVGLFMDTLMLGLLFSSIISQPYLELMWSLWVGALSICIGLQGFAWTFSPHWLVSRYPALSHGFPPPSKTGWIFLRIIGVLMLAVPLWFLATIGALVYSQ
jgi:hypothetical protein